MKRAVFFLAGLLLIQAPTALAGTPVSLRQTPSSGPTITLGDLFGGAGAASGVVIGNGAPPGLNAVLDAGEVARLAHINGLDWDNPAGIRRIIVRGQGGAPTAAVEPTARTIEVLTYARAIMAGEIVQPTDLAYGKVPAFAAPQDAPRDADQIIGKVARRPLREGSAVESRDVSAAQVIKRDDMIEVVYAVDGINLTLQGKAMNAAAAGETLSVLNVNSKKVIEAVAVGPDQAVVGPQAEQIKAATFASPTQFAAIR